MAIQPDILASTLRILRDREVDNTFRAIPLLDAVQRAGNVEQSDGGQKVDCPTILTEHSNITQLSTGYEAVNLAVRDPLRTATYNWCDFIAPIVLTEKEQLSNKGDRAVIKIAEARLKSVMGMLQREYCKQVVAGTSTVLTELESLNGTTNNGVRASGWFDNIAFGDQQATVGGLAKSDYQSSWQNQYISVNEISGATGNSYDPTGEELFRAMTQMMIQTQIYAPEGEVDIILSSPDSYELYKNSLFTQERYTSMTEERNMAGKLGLLFNGAMMYIDPNLPISGIDFTEGDGTNNTTGNGKASMYFLNSKLFNVYFDKDAYFELGDYERISGYAAMAANIMVRTQITTANLSGHGLLINGEAG
jgi:hypothetical protein